MTQTASNGKVTAIGREDEQYFSDLAIALTRFCIQDGNKESQEISERLAVMQSLVHDTKALIEDPSDDEDIGERLEELSAEIMEAVISLQFFDRISQRMEHAVESIEAISDPASIKLKSPEQRFTMEDERILYDALMEGCSVDEALDRANKRLHDTIESHGSDIELF